eukprot:TRINITY_DN95903_c0_g1_i1.p1 TRINITY_DN95903_c0_g1~~TRINITY_DN95903_c0_g1_i1.p1  ORF type:complete len:131 (-),score=0.67 TRINITY_DN95903_c0_g1_i1:135-527(-)
MDDKIKVCFDKEYKIRVLDPTKSSRTEDLHNECGNFSEKISSFSEKISNLVSVLEVHANRIDAQKLRAIGLRIDVEREADQRSRQQKALQSLIAEKKAELDRYNLQYQSLERIEAEQKAQLEKMMNHAIG